MGQLGKMLKRLLNKLLSILKKLVGFIKRYWQYFALILAVVCIMFPAAIPALLAYFGAPAWAVAAGASTAGVIGSWGLMWQGVAAGTAAFLIAPDASKKVVGKVVDSAVEVGGKVVEGAANLTGKTVGAVGSAISSTGFFKWLMVGAAVIVGVKVFEAARPAKKGVTIVNAKP